MRYLLLVLCLCTTAVFFAQEGKPDALEETLNLSEEEKQKLADQKKEQEPVALTIKDYKIISYARDTTYLDTTLTVHKEYKHNYLRKDDFELLPLPNIGQPYNTLGYNFERKSLYPAFGAKGKHFGYWELDDIYYYDVPTPTSDLMFKTTLEQGQLLDALLTLNTSRRLNLAIGFKGFRSLGKFDQNQSESGNFRFSANYRSKNNRYFLRVHYAGQNIENIENGGIADRDQFESGDPDFRDRSRLDVFLNDAENRLVGKRYYFDHQYRLLKQRNDSIKVRPTSLTLGHEFNFETKFYQFIQDNQNDFFGPVFLDDIDDRARLRTLNNKITATFYNKTLGSLSGFASAYNYNYFFNSVLVTDTEEIQSQLQGTEIALGGSYAKRIGKFSIAGDVAINVSGELTGDIINAKLSYDINSRDHFNVQLHSSSRAADFNFLLFQNNYINYNWQNTDTFDQERVSSIQGQLLSPKWGNLTAKYSTLDNYTYFGLRDTETPIVRGTENAFVNPFQETNSVNHLKVTYEKEFKVGNFALNNKVMYQNVSQTNTVLNVPELVTRNTLYFSKDVFKRALFLQTGITLKYFTSYNQNAYNPLLGEFYIQNTEEFGGFPVLDFFINAKVKQTRIFLKAEHFNSSFSGFNFYSAPDYPFRDFVIRFGLVWNFFS